MIKYILVLIVISLLLVAFAARALPSNTFHIQEERVYDKFGLVDHKQEGEVELNAENDIKTIKIDYIAKIEKACKMKLKANIPDVFDPMVKIVKTNVPITSDFTLDTDNVDRKLKVEIEIKLNQKIDEEDIADKYLSDTDEFLQADGLFDSPIDNPEVQKIANSIDKGQSILELVENIKNYTKNALKYSEGETNFDVAESLDAGIGDCDDYARLFVDISRSLGIPARVAFNSKHMWAEVLLPMKDGYRWMIVDPLDSYEDISYSLSLDIETECENQIIENETWTFG